jgi:predicted regulator of Ras-like GTPase activity (Roadblock/LC7/MglB family)
MEAAQALADLTEVSSQIQSAVLADAEGQVLASTFADDRTAQGVAESALALLAASEASGSDRARLTHLVAETSEGAVFVVRERDRVVAAVTGPQPTVGLIFYDLRTCLRLAAEPTSGDGADGERGQASADTAAERGSGDA